MTFIYSYSFGYDNLLFAVPVCKMRKRMKGGKQIEKSLDHTS